MIWARVRAALGNRGRFRSFLLSALNYKMFLTPLFRKRKRKFFSYYVVQKRKTPFMNPLIACCVCSKKLVRFLVIFNRYNKESKQKSINYFKQWMSRSLKEISWFSWSIIGWFQVPSPIHERENKLLLRKKLKRYDNMNTLNICRGFSFYQP